MNILKIGLVSILSVGLSLSVAFAAGNAVKGKALFNNPQLAGGKAGKSCNSCHPNGERLENVSDKKDLPKVINSCIENALNGKAVDSKSSEMADLIAYIKSLKGK